MKKRKLFEQNIKLFGQLDSAAKEIELLKAKLKETEEELRSAKNEIAQLKKHPAENPPENILTENSETPAETRQIVIDNSQKVNEFKVSFEPADSAPELKDDLSYAADVIGKIVIESAKYSNKLTSGSNTEYMELVNLILGKTEVAKSEILSVTREDIPLASKQEKIDGIKTAAIEYFDSVMAQRT